MRPAGARHAPLLTVILPVLPFLFMLWETGQASVPVDFFPLISEGGARWNDIGSVHLALHPSRNRLYTLAQAQDGYRLLHRDTTTAALIASTSSAAPPEWRLLDLDVWGQGEEVLAAWGMDVASERNRATALETFNARTGLSATLDTDTRFLLLTVDQSRARAWGVIEENQSYHVASLDLSTQLLTATSTHLSSTAAIVRDVALDSARQILYLLWQPTKPFDPNLTETSAAVSAFDLPAGSLRGEVAFRGNYRTGGLALDASRQWLYAVEQDGPYLHRFRADSLVADATLTNGDVGPDFSMGGAVAVHEPSGDILVSNGDEIQAASRVVRLDFEARTLVRAWPAGIDCSQLRHDPRLDLVDAGSYVSHSVTVLEASQTPELAQVVQYADPHGLIFDASNRRVLLKAGSGDVYAFDVNTRHLSNLVAAGGPFPAVPLALDPPRNRFFTGTFGDNPPAAYDSATLTRVTDVSLSSASAMAIGPQRGVIYQAQSTPSEGRLLLRSATDGQLLREVVSPLLRGTWSMAADDAHAYVYGITLAPAPVRLWSYHEPSHTLAEMALPPAAGHYLSQLAVDPDSGRVAATDEYGAIRLYLYASAADTAPTVEELAGIQQVLSLVVDSSRQLAVVLGFGGNPLRTRLGWVGLAGSPTWQTVELGDAAASATLAALDEENGELWLASPLPSGLLRLPWPWPEGIPKAARAVRHGGLDLTADARPGYNHLAWSKATEPATVLRRDGELAEFRPLLPLALPAGCTEYFDEDVAPGVAYTYRLQPVGAGLAAEALAVARPPARDSVHVGPLSLVSRLPQGGTDAQTVLLSGNLRPDRHAAVSFAGVDHLAGLQVDVTPERVLVPGVFTVRLAAESSAAPGDYYLPIDLDINGERRRVDLFAQVGLAPAGAGGTRAPFPAGSRSVGLHTDSTLREQAGNLFVFKGEIEDLFDNVEDTALVLRVDLGDGRVILRRDVFARNGLFSAGVALPQPLGPDTVVRARATWIGSNNSLGGTSPVLSLPVGAYSQSGRKSARTSRAASAEPAFFVLGATPTRVQPAPSDSELHGIIHEAASTCLTDYGEGSPAPHLGFAGFLSELAGLQQPPLLLIYVLAETDPQTGDLRDGQTSLSPSQLAEAIRLTGSRQTVVVVEGPQSGGFADESVPYPPGTTVVTSSGVGDLRNTLSPSDRSFSHHFFHRIGLGRTIQQAYDGAALRVAAFDSFYGSKQNPVHRFYQAPDTFLNRRFVPGGLPDLDPPQLVSIRQERDGDGLRVTVRAADNRDRPADLTVAVELSNLAGAVVESATLTPPAEADGAHAGLFSLPSPPGAGLRISAMDRAGNPSAPVSLWISRADNGLFFDLDQNGAVDTEDLLQWALHPAARYNHWLLDFGQHWWETAHD